jgi:hypothetical protein
MKRGIFATSIAIILIFITSGCMKLNMNLVVNEDDTVSGDMIIAYSNQALALAESYGSSNALDVNNLITKQDGMTVTPYKDDSYTGSKVTFAKKPFSAFSTGTSADSLTFTKTGNIVKVSGVLDMSGNSSSSVSDAMSNPLTASLFSTSDIAVTITMPGKVTSSTGTVNGQTVTFKGKLGDKLVISAEADETKDNTLLFVGIGAAVLAALGAAAFILRRKSKAVPAEAAVEPSDDF